MRVIFIAIMLLGGVRWVGAWRDLPPLDEVTHWFYYLDVNLETETFEEVASSSYDMIVIDFIPSEVQNTDYPIADIIDRMHTAAHPKLVFAYIDIGQVEDYRTYWQDEWFEEPPEWIVGEDPDGWEGNYPVAFWYDEYRALWLDDDTGYLPQIVNAGFDGVYLDWVEAYSDERVMAFADADGVDPVREMIWWVQDIAEFTRARRPDFMVIAQNAAELARDDDYVDAIDAIAQEQVWFDGGADNDPPGDCPLPRTEAEIDTTAYYESLSGGCQRLYDEYPESTLHVSSEWYLDDLTYARDLGVTIFTVDYAVQPENIAWVYETARGYGFVPFVSTRALDVYLPPYENAP